MLHQVQLHSLNSYICNQIGTYLLENNTHWLSYLNYAYIMWKQVLQVLDGIWFMIFYILINSGCQTM
jgi:hypothetical protein